MRADVLIVDDNPINLKLASDVLEAAGYHVLCVTCAEATLAALETYTPHLLLVDIGLPGTDGLALTRLLRRDSRYPDLRIVALTAFSMTGDRQRALDAGCNGFISKPINTRTFAAQVAGYLGTNADNGRMSG
jgi:CheY-like chemotaxis protein